MEIDDVATFRNLYYCIVLILFMSPSWIKQSYGSESYVPLELDINQYLRCKIFNIKGGMINFCCGCIKWIFQY